MANDTPITLAVATYGDRVGALNDFDRAMAEKSNGALRSHRRRGDHEGTRRECRSQTPRQHCQASRVGRRTSSAAHCS